MAINALTPQAYTDLKGLGALKREARAQTPEALREAARQFESIFTRMMLKSMREASSGDPLFDSQQTGFYRDMFDDQIAVDMSSGHGLGLAEQLVQQMQRAAAVREDGTASVPELSPAAPATTKVEPVSDGDFLRGLLPSAVAAGRSLGVDPSTLLAHAALETGWGRSLPHSSSGKNSNNFFGIKAGANWRGESVSATTLEYQADTPQSQQAQFRAYGSANDSFSDYVTLLRGNPRYGAALNTGADAKAFATALQRGGYATDPKYADKLAAVAQRVRAVMDVSLKNGSPTPIPQAQAPG